MPVPPELQQMIAKMRQQYPQLAHLPDEQVVQLILQTVEEELLKTPANDEKFQNMSPVSLIGIGERMLNTGQWDTAEQYFLQALENAERLKEVEPQIRAIIGLGRLCRDRGDISHAIALYQRALTMAEDISDQQLICIIYDQMGSTYFLQSNYPQAIECYQKSLNIKQQQEDEEGLAVSYGNLGIVYKRQGDFKRISRELW
jgi:tetratricopeptide (TPR) repeat protein